MTDESRDEIQQAIETGDVEKLRQHWREKIEPIHQQMFRAIGQLEPLVVESQKQTVEKLLEAERQISSYDAFVAASQVSYTMFSDRVRRAFRHLFKEIEELNNSAVANGQVGVVEISTRLNELACEASNVDCFRLLFNGYLSDVEAGKLDNE